MRKKLALAVLFGAVIAGAYVYAGSYARQRIEETIAHNLHQTIGPARSYDVTITGSLIEIARGNLSAATIRGKHVETDKGIRLDRLLIRLRGVRFELGSPSMLDAEETTFETSVTEAELSSYLSRTRADIPDLRIALLDGKFRLSASSISVGRSTPVNAEGTLAVADGTRLICNLVSVTCNGKTAPTFFRNVLENRLNPVLDLTKWRFSATLKSAVVRRGSVTLTGSADLTSRVSR